MFAGEDTIRFRSAKRGSELEAIIEHALDRLGRVEFFKGGVFKLVGPRLQSALSTTAVTGRRSRGRKDDEWLVDGSDTVSPRALCGVVGGARRDLPVPARDPVPAVPVRGEGSPFRMLPAAPLMMPRMFGALRRSWVGGTDSAPISLSVKLYSSLDVSRDR